MNGRDRRPTVMPMPAEHLVAQRTCSIALPPDAGALTATGAPSWLAARSQKRPSARKVVAGSGAGRSRTTTRAASRTTCHTLHGCGN
jgi:hypothetical protein